MAHSIAYELLIQEDRCKLTHCLYNKYGFCKLDADKEVPDLPCEKEYEKEFEDL